MSESIIINNYLECASGIMSSATIKIIAPAAKARPIGKIFDAKLTATAPIIV